LEPLFAPLELIHSSLSLPPATPPPWYLLDHTHSLTTSLHGLAARQATACRLGDARAEEAEPVAEVQFKSLALLQATVSEMERWLTGPDSAVSKVLQGVGALELAESDALMDYHEQSEACERQWEGWLAAAQEKVHSDEKVANRDIRVRHGVTENGP
jgi:hypothetical protein